MKQTLSLFNYSFRNQDDSTVDINIDGYIVDAPTQELLKEFWGDETSVSFKSLRNQIEKANPKTINLFVNSGGGHVGDAMAMHDYLVDLENKGITVNRVGRGIVASAATYLVVGKNSSMTENSWFMVHNVQGGIWGDVVVIENYAKTMRKFNNAIRDFYANVSGQEPEQVSALMNKETWMTAKEAKEKGFIKNVTGSQNFSNSIKPEHWPYQNTAVLNAYNSFTSNNSNMDLKKIGETIENAVNTAFDSLLNKLGIKKEDNAAAENAGKEFANAVTNAITESLKGVGDGVDEKIKNAVADALKETPEAFKNTVTEALKNCVSKDDLKNSLDGLKDAIVNKLGNPGNNEKKPKNEKTGPRNRFSNVEWFPENN